MVISFCSLSLEFGVEEADLITLSLFCATLSAHEAIHERDRRGHLSQPQHLVFESGWGAMFCVSKGWHVMVKNTYTKCWITEMLTDIWETKKNLILFPFVIGIVIPDSTKNQN